MKVIFLDLDGVVNDADPHGLLIKEEYVDQLKKLIAATNAKVVITSRQRDNALINNSFALEDSYCYNAYIKPLLEMGIDVFGYTPRIKCEKEEKERELEIESYLDAHPEIEEYVIIEDDYVMERLFDHQIFIEYSDGFTSEYLEPAIRILNGELGFYPPEYDRSETFDERIRRLFPSLFVSPESDGDDITEEELDSMLDMFKFTEDKTWDDIAKELLRTIPK